MLDRVELRLRGWMLEKFVERAAREGIRFQWVERTSANEMRLAASEKDAKRLMALAEEYRMDLTATGEAGYPHWKRRFHERGSLALGGMMCLLLILSFTSRIWRVEAISADGAADEALLQAVGQYVRDRGAQIGALRSDIDREMLGLSVQENWPEVTHAGVRFSGVCLYVEIATEESAPDVYDVSDSRDLVASRDAIVVSTEPLAGMAGVKAGDIVRKGQVLIRGEERIDTGVTRRIRAMGRVVGRVWFTAECRIPTEETVRTRTGSKRVSSLLRLGGWELALSEAADYPCQDTEEELLPIGGLYLPLRIVRTIRWEAEEHTAARDREALTAQGEAWALELAREKLPDGAEETGCWVDYEEKDGIMTIRATIEAQMDIAADRSELTDGMYE